MQVLYQLSDYYKKIINDLVDTNLEVNVLDSIFKKHKVKSVLDVACGVGRHSIPLAKLGYQVTGIDLSPYQIKKAKEDAKKEKVKTSFVIQDANSFYYNKKFDAAICMWTTLGEEPMQYKKVIRNVFHALKNHGIFIIDNRSWEHIPKEREEIIKTSAKLDSGGTFRGTLYDRYTENFRIRDGIINIDGKKYRDLCVTHLLKEADWIRELKEAGFKRFKVYHDYKEKRVKKPARVLIAGIK